MLEKLKGVAKDKDRKEIERLLERIENGKSIDYDGIKHNT